MTRDFFREICRASGARQLAIVAICSICSAPALAAERAGRYLDKPTTWFASQPAKDIAANIISQQSSLGGWPKHVDTTTPAPPETLKAPPEPTFDNGATTDELRYLARSYGATHDEQTRQAFERGIDYILKAQYPNGGWPQRDPPGRGYHRHITFNDDSMVRLMRFLREVTVLDAYSFVDADRKAAAGLAFERAIDCILKCQIKVDGKLTAWCAQHDEQDFSPRPARAFELVSISGAESVEIVRLLMSLDEPSPQVAASINAAIAWFESVKLTGIRQVIENDAQAPRGTNKVIVKDDSAPPLWARFYEIGTNRPLFVDRDGVPRYDLSQIGYERRNGYSWLSERPRPLLEQEYPAWQKKHQVRTTPA